MISGPELLTLIALFVTVFGWAIYSVVRAVIDTRNKKKKKS